MTELLSRRGFFRRLGAAAAVATVSPTYFFAPIGGWKSDTIVNPFGRFDDMNLAPWFEFSTGNPAFDNSPFVRWYIDLETMKAVEPSPALLAKFQHTIDKLGRPAGY